jgi:hypothetical protein
MARPTKFNPDRGRVIVEGGGREMAARAAGVGLRTLAGWLAKGVVGGLPWWAHVGGFTAGLVLHSLFVRPRRVIRRLQPEEYGIEGAWL